MTKHKFILALTLALAATVALEAAAQPPGGKRGRRGQFEKRADTGLKIGEQAPEFTLMSPDGKSETILDTLRSEKPVVLFFGSYT